VGRRREFPGLQFAAPPTKCVRCAALVGLAIGCFGYARMIPNFLLNVVDEVSTYFPVARSRAENRCRTAPTSVSELEQVSHHERQAIWLQTEAGWDWLWELDNPEDERGKPAKVPFDDSESADYVYRKYLLPFAEEYSNSSIDQYLEKAQRARFEMDRGS
jgi:hypothetical protein